MDAQFSIPWGVATAIARRQVTMQDFTEAAIGSREILDLTARLKAEVDPALKNPQGIEPAKVTIVMTDGGTYSAQADHPLGSPERPMSLDDCVRKFEDCVSFSGGWLPEENMKRIIDRVRELEKVKDVRQIIGLLT